MTDLPIHSSGVAVVFDYEKAVRDEALNILIRAACERTGGELCYRVPAADAAMNGHVTYEELLRFAQENDYSPTLDAWCEEYIENFLNSAAADADSDRMVVMSMVERVARAAAAAVMQDFDSLLDDRQEYPGTRKDWLDIARAAIEAMRDVTGGMADAGQQEGAAQVIVHCLAGSPPMAVAEFKVNGEVAIFTAMIAAALAEG